MAKRKSQSKVVYSVHPAVRMAQKVIANMQTKTGRSLEQWIKLIKNEGPATDKEQRAWLKSAHKLGTNYAAWIVDRAGGKGEQDSNPDNYLKAAAEYVDEMYSKKSALRPIHDALIDIALSLGNDICICPCKTIVPIYRNHVIAQIKPATQKRIDFGLALSDTKAKGILIDTGGFAKKDRITHRIAISSTDDINDEVRRWLDTAYSMDD